MQPAARRSGERWLDADEREWFSFLGRGNGLTAALGKVFWVTARVHIDELRRALAKSLRGAGDAPIAALATCLVDVAGCAMDGSFVRPGRLRRPTSLTPVKATLRCSARASIASGSKHPGARAPLARPTSGRSVGGPRGLSSAPRAH